MWRIAQLVIVAAAFAGLSQPAFAYNEDEELKRFFGTYEGHTISEESDGLTNRDLNITIAPFKDSGFTMSWTTILKKPDGRNKTKSYKISFFPSKREGVFGSAMRRNAFGHAVPLDPLKGEPYVWASVIGDKLVMHSLYIADDGGYEMQNYTRTLTKDGLDTRFERVRNGEKLKVITGVLKKVK